MVGETIAATVINDDPEVPRQVVHLRLPQARMRDRSGRKKDDGLPPRSKDLVVKPQPIAGDREAAGVRLPGASARLCNWHRNLSI